MKTGTVMDSVHQINTRCMTLIREAESLPYVDIGIAANLLNTRCKEMLDLFDRSPDAYEQLTDKKKAAESAAIRLETFMYHQANMYENTVAMRVFANKLYNDVRSVFYRATKMDDLKPSEVALWGSYCKWAMQFSLMSKHILFEMDEDDEEKVKEISDALKVFYANYGER